MGQQQLLLIVLGVIIVGIAIILGINLFKSSSIENKRDLLVNETQNLATMAIQYYKKAKMLGGGQYSYAGWEIPEGMKVTQNGSYTRTLFPPDMVEIFGTGTEVISTGDSIKVKTTVNGTTIVTQIIH